MNTWPLRRTTALAYIRLDGWRGVYALDRDLVRSRKPIAVTVALRATGGEDDTVVIHIHDGHTAHLVIDSVARTSASHAALPRVAVPFQLLPRSGLQHRAARPGI